MVNEADSKLPTAVHDFLGEVESRIKQHHAVFPERVLCELRDQIAEHFPPQQCAAMQDAECQNALAEQFGSPDQIAAGWELADQPPVNGNAPNWRVCCTQCGRSSPADRLGMTRIAARSYHKYILGQCSHCQKLVSLRVIRDLHLTNLSDRMTWLTQPADLLGSMHKPKLTLILILAFVVLSMLVTGVIVRSFLP